MKKKNLICTLVFACIFLCTSLVAYKYEEPVKKSFPTGTESNLKITGINGNITVSNHHDDTMITVKAVKMADNREEFEKLTIEFRADGQNIVIQTKNKDNTCKAAVDFTVSVPNQTPSLNCLTILGNITVTGNYQNITCKTVNGSITFQGNFTNADFSTVSEAISVTVRDNLEGNLLAHSYNGDIKIEMTPASAFVIKAESLNGLIENDYGLPISTTTLGKTLEGTINNGYHKVSLKSRNGTIHIMQK